MPDKITARELLIRRGGCPILQVDELDITPGRMLAVLGENGSGKTSLLRVLAGLDHDTSGNLRYNGRHPAEFFAAGGRPTAVILVPQEPVMFDTTVERNITYGLRLAHISRTEILQRLEQVLNELQIPHLRHRRAPALSGGEIRRVALARAFILRPRFLLLDEPFAGIDTAFLGSLETILEQLPLRSDPPSTVVFTTHQEGIALRLTRDILQIHDGRLIGYHPSNVFRGAARLSDGEASFESGGLDFIIPPFTSPPRLIHIPPTDIILSRSPLTSTARNCFRGEIVSLARNGSLVDVTVDIGQPLVARITHQSLKDHALSIGDPVYVQFKTAAIRFPDQEIPGGHRPDA